MPAPLLFVVSAIAQYVGAAVAVDLFDRMGPGTVAWLRVAIAALVLVLWTRPWGSRGRWTRPALRTAALFGVVLAVMNVAFYVALDTLPLGTAVALEFAGPVAVAAITGSGWRDRAAIVVAASGVVLLAGVSLHLGDEAVRGLVAIAVAATCWALYIVLGRRVATAPTGGLTGLGVAMAAGALVLAPFLARDAGPVLTDARLAVLVVLVALLSSVVPYGIEQVVLRRVRPATFAVLLALLPATAAVVGAVMLQQVPHGVEVVGLVLVSGAIALTARTTDADREAPPPA
ncbi:MULTISPECIES: EamA family transporter [Cellulomonas]|uniref:Permease n=1 Tax=Cellulomonas gelida TaxID=1712 RepID=A0A4Y3KQV4_9CELL|nr:MULTISPECIES: EamA family transporter [Cellulomonas]MCR6705345.1 EamA family transporter [Cellulomonas sp.]GEA85340.1 permease [Cellulomonas gelida]GGL18827.1 permease [Cellulomonas gelida]